MAGLKRSLAAGAALVALVPMAASAQESRAGEIARQLDDPLTQYMVAGAIAAMGKNLLEMNIEPLVRAVESAGGGGGAVSGLPRDARLGDLAGVDAEALPDQVMRRVPKAMGAAAGMAGAIDQMLPELHAMGRRMKDALPGS